MKQSQQILFAQIQKIHIAKKELSISDDDYRSILSSYNAVSSKDLSREQADNLLNLLKQLGWKEKQKPKTERSESDKIKGTGKQKFEYLGNRGDEFPSPGQLRKIDALWKTHARDKSDSAMNNFIKRVTGLSNITWIKKEDVKKLIKAIESL